MDETKNLSHKEKNLNPKNAYCHEQSFNLIMEVVCSPTKVKNGFQKFKLQDPILS